MAITGTAFWDEFLTILEGGTRTSVVEYYLPQGGSQGIGGSFAQTGEWANVIEQTFARTGAGSPERARLVDLLKEAEFWDPTDDLDFWKNQEINSLDVTDLANAAEARFPTMFGANDEPALIGGKPNPEVDVGGGVTTRPGAPAEENQAEEGVGGGGVDSETQLTILTGDEMEWHFDRNSGKWYVEYGLPGSTRTVIFEAEPDQMDALFGAGNRPIGYTQSTLAGLTQRGGTTFSGNIAEMEGVGRFESEVERVQTLALDEGRLPEWALASPEVMDIIYVAQAEGKTDAWALEQIATTAGFKTRFPGIMKLKDDGNLTLDQAVSGFLEYESGVRATLQASGLSQEIATPETIGNLLDAGHSLKVIQDTASKFRRAKEFAPAMDAFNAVLTQQGLQPITELQDMMDFMGGKASADVYDLWEASSLRETAVTAGLGDIFTAEDAFSAALEGNHTLETATQSMQRAAQLLLRLRHEVDTGAFGLNHEELIDISLGQAVRSGRSSAEVQESINRAVASATAERKGRARPFKQFGSSGTPEAASLRNVRQES